MELSMEGTVKASSASPCAACKLLRRRCAEDCAFAPYFPAEEPLKFASVHKVFGASNVNKMLQELPMPHRGDAVSSMVYEANARIRDPIYGCVGAISYLQQQVGQLQTQLAVAQAEIVYLQMQQEALISNMVAQKEVADEQKAMAFASPSPSPSPQSLELRDNYWVGSMELSGLDEEPIAEKREQSMGFMTLRKCCEPLF